VTGEVPDDVRVTEYFAVVFVGTSPNAMLDELTLSVDIDALNCKVTLFEIPFAAATRFTLCPVGVDAAVAVNMALEAFIGTVTVGGTETRALLLDKATLSPPFGAVPLKVTVHVSLPALVMETALQERLLSTPLLWPWFGLAIAIDAKGPRSNIGRNHEPSFHPRALPRVMLRSAELLSL